MERKISKLRNIKVTVFTPTFNRGYIIEKLYNSLKLQTSAEFEWVVVDDGSSDNTEELIKGWMNEDNFFSINYVKVKNGGKHRAINRGVKLAKGKLFFIVDSDDYLTSDAIEKLLNWEASLPDKLHFAGVAGARGYSNSQMIGSGHGVEYIDCKNEEREKYGLRSDKAEAYYTEILKQFPFPEFENENFITESVVWNAISRAGYKIRWYDQIIYIGEYRDDGLTADNMGLFMRNPKGHLLALKSDFSLPSNSLKRKMAIIGMYYKVGKRLDMDTGVLASDLGVPQMLLILFGYMRDIIDRARNTRN